MTAFLLWLVLASTFQTQVGTALIGGQATWYDAPEFAASQAVLGLETA